MDALVDLALNHGVAGILAIVLIGGAWLGYRHWRDVVAERDFWRATAIKALQAGETLASRDDGGEGGSG